MNNDFGHSWSDLPMTFTRDFVTREHHCQIISLVTKKIVIHGNSCIILYFTDFLVILVYLYIFMVTIKVIPITLSLQWPLSTMVNTLYYPITQAYPRPFLTQISDKKQKDTISIKGISYEQEMKLCEVTIHWLIFKICLGQGYEKL